MAVAVAALVPVGPKAVAPARLPVGRARSATRTFTRPTTAPLARSRSTTTITTTRLAAHHLLRVWLRGRGALTAQPSWSSAETRNAGAAVGYSILSPTCDATLVLPPIAETLPAAMLTYMTSHPRREDPYLEERRREPHHRPAQEIKKQILNARLAA